MIVKEDSDIASAADMADKKICVIQGYTGEICVKNLGYPYEAFKKGTDAIMELVNGKCDVVVIDSATAQKYVLDNQGLKIVEDASAFESEEYAIAVKKEIQSCLTRLIKQLKQCLQMVQLLKLVHSISKQFQQNSCYHLNKCNDDFTRHVLERVFFMYTDTQVGEDKSSLRSGILKLDTKKNVYAYFPGIGKEI